MIGIRAMHLTGLKKRFRVHLEPHSNLMNLINADVYLAVGYAHLTVNVVGR